MLIEGTVNLVNNYIKMLTPQEQRKYEHIFIEEYISSIGKNTNMGILTENFNIKLKKCVFELDMSRDKRKIIRHHMEKVFSVSNIANTRESLNFMLKYIIDNECLFLLSKFLSSCAARKRDIKIFSKLSSEQLTKVIDSFILNKMSGKMFSNTYLTTTYELPQPHKLSNKYLNDLVDVFPEYIVDNINMFENYPQHFLLAVERVKFAPPYDNNSFVFENIYSSATRVFKFKVDDFLNANPDIFNLNLCERSCAYITNTAKTIKEVISRDENKKMQNIRQTKFMFRNSNVPKYFMNKKLDIISDILICFVYRLYYW